MRILSQDGIKDIPYETIMIDMYETDGIYSIYGITLTNYYPRILIAQYSTQEKAMKALQMFRSNCLCSEQESVYKDNTTCISTHFQFPEDDEVKI